MAGKNAPVANSKIYVAIRQASPAGQNYRDQSEKPAA
jgi:hypothetical protein